MDGLLQAGSTTLPGWLEVTAGPAEGQRIAVQDELRFGTAEAGPGRLEGDRWLSPSHAVLRRGSHGWTVEDLRSLEGTKVNGRPVRGATVVGDGDVIELGASRLVMAPEAASTGPAGMDLRNVEVRNTGKRILASLADSLVVFPFSFAFGYVSHGRYVVVIAWLALWLSYNFLCDSLGGQTAGKWMLGLRVVRIDGTPLRPQAAAARTVLRLIGLVIPILDPICLLVTRRHRQRAGDLVAKTVVARATTPHAPPARSPRDRQLLIAYPLLWLAPAVLLYLFVPSASIPACSDPDFAPPLGKEGSCHDAGGRIATIVDAGHVLHLSGFDAQLLATSTRPIDSDRSVVTFRLKISNTGTRVVRLSLPRHSGINFSVAGGSGFVVPARPVVVSRGRARTVSDRFVVSDDILPALGQPVSDFDIVNPADPTHLGQIRLWKWAGRRGERVLSGLSG